MEHRWARGGDGGGIPPCMRQTLCSNVRVFWLYHPPSGFKIDRCSPMCDVEEDKREEEEEEEEEGPHIPIN